MKFDFRIVANSQHLVFSQTLSSHYSTKFPSVTILTPQNNIFTIIPFVCFKNSGKLYTSNLPTKDLYNWFLHFYLPCKQGGVSCMSLHYIMQSRQSTVLCYFVTINSGWIVVLLIFINYSCESYMTWNWPETFTHSSSPRSILFPVNRK